MPTEFRRGLSRVLDYPATHLPALLSRDGRQTVVLAAFATRDRAAAAVDRLRPQLSGSGVRDTSFATGGAITVPHVSMMYSVIELEIAAALRHGLHLTPVT